MTRKVFSSHKNSTRGNLINLMYEDVCQQLFDCSCSAVWFFFHQEEQQRLAAKEKAAKELEAAKQRDAAAQEAAKTQVQQNLQFIETS